MLQSHSLHQLDFSTKWYKRWAKELRQDKLHLEGHALYANKFWQNAVMAQVLSERKVIVEGARGVGFGVGQERLPALFAKYGVDITATDQDFTKQKAGHWAEHELATGSQSLNTLGICGNNKFVRHVEYEPVDMKRIPKRLHGKYDFLWSNCALGHLGSIPNGLQFIENSLLCLKPGGWAVHTTEVNILSNDQTVDSGDTVIFRVGDIYRLQQKLVRQGYKVSPFILTLGKSPKDKRISLAPQFGNDYSKIQFKGHLLTQVLLLIHRPKHIKHQPKNLQQLVVNYAYRRNLIAIERYKRTDSTIRQIIQSRRTFVDKIKLKPKQIELHTKIPKGKTNKLRISYVNNSSIPLFGVSTEISAKPIVLATTEPINRPSSFVDSIWLSNNRPSPNLWVKSSTGNYQLTEFVEPRQDFSFEVILNANKKPKGKYKEGFCIVQETIGWVSDSTIHVSIEIV